MTFSHISHLSCAKCSFVYKPDEVHQLCRCGSPLLVNYDLSSISMKVKRAHLLNRSNDLWRYHELLPVQHPDNIVSLGEGMTPLLPMKKIGQEMGLPRLLMKDESLTPTGTFKARGAALGVSKAKELGVKAFVMPTNGNAGAAWSLYAAKAGIEAVIVMPVAAPPFIRSEVAATGSRLFFVDGLISDAGKMVAKAAADFHLYDASTLKEPYRIEGKKTMGYEIAEMMDWQVPDVIIYPAGGGVGLIGIYKAFRELQQLRWVDQGKMPRLVAVQSEGCAPIVKAWQEGKMESELWRDSKTVAFGINVPKALGDFLVLKAIYETNGFALAVNDEEILEEQKRIVQTEGAFVCPEGAATFLAARKLGNAGVIDQKDTVVTVNTGMGLKYLHVDEQNTPVLQRDGYIKSLIDE
ncbi:threonine synthase [Siminovitchia sp. FSL W7-1587]|uniref:threonine synthase n=1 Tax=Siminovitchia sp. FSL W7-1587 TaxID=2954699 RepID=UPI0030D112C9